MVIFLILCRHFLWSIFRSHTVHFRGHAFLPGILVFSSNMSVWYCVRLLCCSIVIMSYIPSLLSAL